MKDKNQKARYEMVGIRIQEIKTQLSQPAHAESFFPIFSNFTKSNAQSNTTQPPDENLNQVWGYNGNLIE